MGGDDTGGGGSGGQMPCPYCDGDVVTACDGTPVETCDSAAGIVCSNGACVTACEAAVERRGNDGCELWAVDLDQQDGGGNDPASAPFGLLLANPSKASANVTIELNDAPVGESPAPSVVLTLTLAPGATQAVILPTREVDCGLTPNDYGAPGSCLSSRAFRVTSTVPIVAYQANGVSPESFSNDTSLLLPKHALGQAYSVLGWRPGHPVPIVGPVPEIRDRAFITIVGTEPNTTVSVQPTWTIKGNAPITETAPGGTLTLTIGPFDVLNLEGVDGLQSDPPTTVGDLSGSTITTSAPVAVFSGVETGQVPVSFDLPTFPGFDPASGSCCLDHLEEQLVPNESLGRRYVVGRSPVRSTSNFREPDVIRFVGGDAPSTITTTLPDPAFQSFTLQPGEVKTTYTQEAFVAEGSAPFALAQLLVGMGMIDGPPLGDPSITLVPALEHRVDSLLAVTAASWTETWLVVTLESGTDVTIDGAAPAGCIVEDAGTLGAQTFESWACPLPAGLDAHQIAGSGLVGAVLYGYSSAASYAAPAGGRYP